MKAIFKPGNKFPVPFFYGLFLMLLTSGNAFSYTRIGIHKPSPESNRLNFLKSNLRIMKKSNLILGLALSQDSKYTEAEPYLKKAIELNSSDIKHINNRM